MSPADAVDLQKTREEHGPILSHYVNMAQVLGEMFKPALETVVHDLEDPKHSIIAIFNGHLTGRKVGDPATNLVRKLVAGEFPDVVIRYANESPNGQKLKSSSLAIRNGEGELIGVMGLNLDVSYFEQFSKFVERFISTERNEYVPQAEHFRSMAPEDVKTPKEDIKEAVDEYIIAQNWGSRILSNNEKRRIVEFLYREGYFRNRGAVTAIADILGLARPSVYNYKNAYLDRQSQN